MSKQGVCYVFGAGEYKENPSIKPGPKDLVIAADGGYLYTERHGISVDLILGDFDSLPEPPKSNREMIVLPREKDDTDMLAALQEGWRRGYRSFYIYGGTGGRLDHTLANVQCLASLAIWGGCGFLYDQNVVITAIHNSSILFPAHSKGTISVFSHSEHAHGVYERGLKYPLDNATLKNSYPLGISNEFVGVPSSISVKAGTLIIVFSKNIIDTHQCK